MRARVGKDPKYSEMSDKRKDKITAGIYQNYDDKTKRKLRAQYAGKDEKDFGGWTSHNLDWERGFREGERKAEDRERGIETQRTRTPQLEGKQSQQLQPYTDEDNPVRVEQRRERQAGLRYRAGERKQQHQKPGTVVANVSGMEAFRASLPKQRTVLDVIGSIESGEMDKSIEEQLNPQLKGDLGPLADPEKHGKPFSLGEGEEPSYHDLSDITGEDDELTPIRIGKRRKALHPEMIAHQDHPGVSCDKAHPGEQHESWKIRNKDADAEWKQFYAPHSPQPLPTKIKRYSLFMPFEVRVATKSFGGIEKGDLVVEGFVSAPIKDLQGDVLELNALMQAKNVMTRPPYDHVWLDHESPYAKPLENQGTPPIGKFVAAKIMKIAGLPALWARMIVNKAHPDFERVAYELRKGFYNAFSMEFMPDPQVPPVNKMIGNKLVNAISSIKYFATCLVRAPANEVATVTSVYEKGVAMPVASFPPFHGQPQRVRVYEKAFANSSRFLPIRVKSLVGFGQTVIQKERLENLQTTRTLQKQRLKEAEPEVEPEPEMEMEMEQEPEEWTGQEQMPQARPRITAGQRPTSKEAEPEPEEEQEPEGEPEGAAASDDGGPLAMRGIANDSGSEDDDELQEKTGTPEYPYSRKDYDRETGYVAPERATTAIGEWGDPALEKARLAKRVKRLEGQVAGVVKYLPEVSNSINRLGVYAQRNTHYLKAYLNSQGIDTKGIDEGLAPDTLGVYDDFTTITDEQKPPEVKPGKLKPRTQRFISTFPTKDEDTEDVDSQEVGGEPIGAKNVRELRGLVRKMVDQEMQRKIVVRKGYAEHAGPVPESVRRLQAIQKDDGSIDSQLQINEMAGGP